MDKLSQERARNEKSEGVVKDYMPHPKTRFIGSPNVPGAFQLNYDYDKFPKDRGEGYRRFIEMIKERSKKKKVKENSVRGRILALAELVYKHQG